VILEEYAGRPKLVLLTAAAHLLELASRHSGQVVGRFPVSGLVLIGRPRQHDAEAADRLARRDRPVRTGTPFDGDVIRFFGGNNRGRPIRRRPHAGTWKAAIPRPSYRRRRQHEVSRCCVYADPHQRDGAITTVRDGVVVDRPAGLDLLKYSDANPRAILRRGDAAESQHERCMRSDKNHAGIHRCLDEAASLAARVHNATVTRAFRHSGGHPGPFGRVTS
jgi:hypothetical protein